MATLNIKNFPPSLHRKLQERARRERRSMAQEVTHILARVLEEREPHSILQLEGLGAELCDAAADHVSRERAEFD
ncbi:MAG TPA: hypothetical protein VMN60_12580 [Longimicrobiales bacterium]|nr:hypothetical protein [Longimicrobiales bacterium]